MDDYMVINVERLFIPAEAIIRLVRRYVRRTQDGPKTNLSKVRAGLNNVR